MVLSDILNHIKKDLLNHEQSFDVQEIFTVKDDLRTISLMKTMPKVISIQL